MPFDLFPPVRYRSSTTTVRGDWRASVGRSTEKAAVEEAAMLSLGVRRVRDSYTSPAHLRIGRMATGRVGVLAGIARRQQVLFILWAAR